MVLRLRSDLWIAGFLRRVMAQGGFVAVRRKGEPSAGAIFIRIDRLDGTGALFGPAAQALTAEEAGRRFTRLHPEETTTDEKIEQRLAKETKFDPDCWIIEIEDRHGRSFLDEDLA